MGYCQKVVFLCDMNKYILELKSLTFQKGTLIMATIRSFGQIYYYMVYMYMWWLVGVVGKKKRKGG